MQEARGAMGGASPVSTLGYPSGQIPRGRVGAVVAMGAVLATLVAVVLAGAGERAQALAQAGPDCEATLCAGAAKVDATWHLGAGSGQYANKGPGPLVDPEAQDDGAGVDPEAHATTQQPSYGIETRDWVRALVVRHGGERWALVSNDFYIPQELLNARVAELLEQYDAAHPEAPLGIDATNLTVSVSHNHSSPYYSSTGWGVWTFQDVIDVRFFEWMAERMRDAVVRAASSMGPARVSAATTELTATKANPEGPSIADDGTPATFPDADSDPTLTVVRFDSAGSGPHGLIANWFVYGRHPEGLHPKGIISSEYINDTYRVVDREMGGVTIFSQRDVGTGESTGNAEAHAPVAREEWDSHDFANRQRLARTFATRVEAASRAAATGRPGQYVVGGEAVRIDQAVAPSAVAPLAVADQRFAPPGARASATVSNCQTEQAFMGNPELPVVGLPDCEGPHDALGTPALSPAVDYWTLREAGIPVPDNYGAPSYTGLQETLAVHLQSIRLGDIAITTCPCEEWTDLGRNIVSRLDRTADNFYYGWDWTASYRFSHDTWEPGVAYDGRDGRPLELPLDDRFGGGFWCLPYDADGSALPFDGTSDPPGTATWHCRDPHNWQPWFGGPRRDYELTSITDAEFRRWKAEIYNDATGWDDPANSLDAESEPADPEQIQGNWTREEVPPEKGYALVIPVSMTNNYFGYMPQYREYQARDFYRKALEGLGPHGSDFLATRLTRMAAELYEGGLPPVPITAKDEAYNADTEVERARAHALGEAAARYLPAYEAQLPADGEQPQIAAQPEDVERFTPATLTWIGGSNYTDMPLVRVERSVGGSWVPYGDGYGEVQMMLDFPNPDELDDWRAGQYAWHWTANFETYDSDVTLPDARGRTHAPAGGRGSQVPNGTYRFVVEGCFRPAGTPSPSDGENDCRAYDSRVEPYRLASQAFTVGPWRGIEVRDAQLTPQGGKMSFTLGPLAGEQAGLPAANAPALSASNSDLTTYSDDAGSLSGRSQRYTIGLFNYRAGRVDAIDYPNWYDGAFPYLTPGRSTDAPRRYEVRGYQGVDTEAFCFLCAFEPWADTGAVDRVNVTVERPHGGGTRRVPARYHPATGRWTASVELAPGETAYVAPGAVHDRFGETNGEPSTRLRR